MKKYLGLIILLFSSFMVFSCGPLGGPLSGDDQSSGDEGLTFENNGQQFGDCEGCTGFVIPDLKAFADGISGVALIDETDTSSNFLLKNSSEKTQDASGVYGKIRGKSGLTRLIEAAFQQVGNVNEDLETNGSENLDEDVPPEVAAGVEEETANKENPWGEFPIPKVSIVAASYKYAGSDGKDKQDIWLIFEHQFLFRSPEAGTEANPWEESSRSTCQIFMVTGDIEVTADVANNHGAHLKDITCMNPDLTIDTWNSRDTAVQFDSSNNAYFKARYANSNDVALFKYVKATGETQEIVNPKTNVDNWVVYKNGAVFFRYWQQQGGSGIRLLRLVNGSYEAEQVANENWEFNIIQDNQNSDLAIYHGRSTVSGEKNWQQCFYRFDPTIDDDKSTSDQDERATELVDCNTDFWKKLDALTNNDYKGKNAICSDESYYPGNQVSKLVQGSEGNIYFVGEVNQKSAGVMSCHGQFTENDSNNQQGFCSNYAIDETKTSCEAKKDSSGNALVWKSDNWFNDANGTMCNLTDYPNSQYRDRNVENASCDLSQTSSLYTMLAKIDLSNGSPGTVVPLSALTEEAMNVIPIEKDGKEMLLGLTYNTGTYALNEYDPEKLTSRVLLKETDIYFIQFIEGEVYIVGLYLPTNNYFMGHFDPDSSAIDDEEGIPFDSISKETISGSVDALFTFAH